MPPLPVSAVVTGCHDGVARCGRPSAFGAGVLVTRKPWSNPAMATSILDMLPALIGPRDRTHLMPLIHTSRQRWKERLSRKSHAVNAVLDDDLWAILQELELLAPLDAG